MKRIKLLVGFLVALVILGAGSAPSASAQALDNVWLKLKVNGKGYLVDPATGAYSKANGSSPVYLHFVWNADHYDIAVWTNPDGVWANTFNTTKNTVRPGENFISNFYLHLVVNGSDYIDTYHTPFIKFDKKGKVTYQGTGEVFGGQGGTDGYYGYFTIHGTSVDPSKLPFDPNLPTILR